LLNVNRASWYNQPTGETAENLALMRLIDELSPSPQSTKASAGFRWRIKAQPDLDKSASVRSIFRDINESSERPLLGDDQFLAQVLILMKSRRNKADVAQRERMAQRQLSTDA
jgi:hypothetical protein